MMSKSKAETLRIIHSCAVQYKQNLAHNNLLFVTTQNQKTSYFEAAFLPRNFLHLTGIRTQLKSVDFFNLAVRDRLNERDINFAYDGTTDKKLDVLAKLMNIHLTARMAGNYDYSKSLLVTDKLAGTVTAAMGFAKNEPTGIYVPNTALNTDMRTVSKKPVQKIVAIFIKGKREDKYSKLTYIANKALIGDGALASAINEKVDITNLTADFPIPTASQLGDIAAAWRK